MSIFILWNRRWHTCSAEIQRVNILGFVDHTVSFKTPQFRKHSVNEWACCVPVRLDLWTLKFEYHDFRVMEYSSSFGFFQLFKNIKFFVNSCTSIHPFEGVLYVSIVPAT